MSIAHLRTSLSTVRDVSTQMTALQTLTGHLTKGNPRAPTQDLSLTTPMAPSLDTTSILKHPVPRRSTTQLESSEACDFKLGLCQWRNVEDRSDDFDWVRNQGKTQSLQTGPSTDHTSGTASGYYMYVESSNRQQGERARLASQTFPPVDDQDYCLTFWYNMFGSGIGSLRVIVLTNASLDIISTEATLWELDGSSGDQWLAAQVLVDKMYTKKPFT
ncbi:MAM domain-containing protein 2, partial [Elysia marginata]